MLEGDGVGYFLYILIWKTRENNPWSSKWLSVGVAALETGFHWKCTVKDDGNDWLYYISKQMGVSGWLYFGKVKLRSDFFKVGLDVKYLLHKPRKANLGVFAYICIDWLIKPKSDSERKPRMWQTRLALQKLLKTCSRNATLFFAAIFHVLTSKI